MNRGQNSVNNNKQCQDSKIVKSVSASLDIGIKKKKSHWFYLLTVSQLYVRIEITLESQFCNN